MSDSKTERTILVVEDDPDINHLLMKIGYNELNRYNLFIIIILIGLFLHKLNKRQFNVYNDTG